MPDFDTFSRLQDYKFGMPTDVIGVVSAASDDRLEGIEFVEGVASGIDVINAGDGNDPR